MTTATLARPSLLEFVEEHFPATSAVIPVADGYAVDCPRCGGECTLTLRVGSLIGAYPICVGRGCDGAIHEALSLSEDRWCALMRSVLIPEGVDVHAAEGAQVAGSITDAIMGRDSLAELPQPTPLIADTLDRGTVAFLVGAHGTGKSFIALDWAACVATGSPWMCRPTDLGKVLYILGEGASGLHNRLSAWEEHHGTPIPDDRFRVLGRPLQLANARDVREVCKRVAEDDYDLVVIDTMARAMVGVEENSATAVGAVIAAMDTIRDAMRHGVVLGIHHTGKDGKTVRGSSSMEGAADTVYLLTKANAEGVTKLNRTKRKDGAEEDFHALALTPCRDSLIVAPMGKAAVAADHRIEDTDNRTRAWLILHAVYGTADITFTKAAAVAHMKDGFHGLRIESSTSRYNAFAALVKCKAIVADKGANFRLDGFAAIEAGLPSTEALSLDADGEDSPF